MNISIKITGKIDLIKKCNVLNKKKTIKKEKKKLRRFLRRNKSKLRY
jgi:hypothetical protein